MTSGFKKIVVFTVLVLLVSIGYFIYAQSVYPPTPERETFLTEIGEGVGEVGLWLLVFIYFRTALKLFLGKGAIARRLLPEYTAPVDASLFKKLMIFLDSTHVYFGIASVAIILLHIVLMGVPLTNLFFICVHLRKKLFFVRTLLRPIVALRLTGESGLICKTRRKRLQFKRNRNSYLREGKHGTRHTLYPRA